MGSIYAELVRKVSDGKTFYVNFEDRTMKVGHKYLVKKGVYDNERQVMYSTHKSLDDVLNTIEVLYTEYKYSLPSERSDKRRLYFKALDLEEIPDEKLFVADSREVTRARLEGFVLCSILNGDFRWDEEKLGKWFWQSEIEPELVILKDWIVGKEI